MLRLENIKKNYYTATETVAALRGVSLSFRKNEFVSILGPSGSGKSTRWRFFSQKFIKDLQVILMFL